jgi:hypothetical protein
VRAGSRSLGLGELVRLGVVLIFFVAAPVVGDIGSCGQELEDLDATKFFQFKEGTDCSRCGECGIVTAACGRACDQSVDTAFPEGCYPLVHDGEVCLNALAAASCDDYNLYMSDTAPTVPTECNFCPLDGREEAQ